MISLDTSGYLEGGKWREIDTSGVYGAVMRIKQLDDNRPYL